VVFFFGDFTGVRVTNALVFVEEILVVDQDLFHGVGIAVTLNANITPHGIVSVVKLPLFGASPAFTRLASNGLREEPYAGFLYSAHINAFRINSEERRFPASSVRFPASIKVSSPPLKKKVSNDLISERFSNVLGRCFLRVLWPVTSPRTIKPLVLQRL